MAATVGIEGVYRVYLNLASTDPGAAATIGRYLAIFRNRQTADQFYRFAQGAKNPAGQPALNTLTRQGPQFWNYNSVAYGWPIPVLLLEWFPQWAPKVILTLINDEGGRDVSPIPVQAITEWFNGGAYFIKNTLKTEEYWIQNGSYVTLSSHDATKFVVRSKGLAANEILTIDDPITIELASAASSDNPTYVYIPARTSKLELRSEPWTFTFNDFFANFGIEGWTDSAGVSEKSVVNSSGTSVVWNLV